MHVRSTLLAKAAVGAALAVALVAGCSSDSSDDDADPSASPSVTATAPADAAQASAQVRKNWETLFDGSSTDPKRLDYLQGAAELEAAGALKEDPESKSLGARVTSVTFTSSTSADVVYDILQKGAPLLPGAKGVAVLEDGTWKVSKVTFCQLLVLGNEGKPVEGCA